MAGLNDIVAQQIMGEIDTLTKQIDAQINQVGQLTASLRQASETTTEASKAVKETVSGLHGKLDTLKRDVDNAVSKMEKVKDETRLLDNTFSEVRHSVSSNTNRLDKVITALAELKKDSMSLRTAIILGLFIAAIYGGTMFLIGFKLAKAYLS